MKNKFLNTLNSTELPPSTKNYYFENLILLSLNHLLKTQNKKIFTHYSIKTKTDKILRFDAVLPEGFKDIIGPVLVEIKSTITSRDIESLINSLKILTEEGNFRTLLLILNEKLNNDDRVKFFNEWEIYNQTGIKLVIWDINDIERNLGESKQYKEISKFTNLENIDILYLQTQSDLSDNDINNNDNLEILKATYNNEEIVLFLGSGVSKEYDLPLWDELIGSLSGDVISNLMKLHYLEKDHLSEELSSLLSGNPIISASYLEKGISKSFSESAESEKVRRTFYSKIRYHLYNKFNGTTNSQTQLSFIAQGILNSKVGSGLKSVITYNYDDVLQQHLDDINSSFKLQTIFSDVTKRSSHFPIYHVHGFLPYKEKKYMGYKIEEQDIIFSEESYHKLQSEPYSWRNLTQVNALRENTVVMVGLSLTDPNIRRLLMQTSQRAERNHFILLHRYSGKESNNLQRLSPELSEKFLNLHHQILEENFKKLGVNVIWYDRHQDLPNILGEIFGIKLKQLV